MDNYSVGTFFEGLLNNYSKLLHLGEEKMKSTKLANLALAGILGGSMIFGSTAVKADEAKKEEPKKDADAKYKDVHDCGGKNSCKGLGGCKVTAEKLAEHAKAAGVAADKAGAAHECSGKNACKGLGGCKVDEAKFAKLKAAADKAAKEEKPKAAEEKK